MTTFDYVIVGGGTSGCVLAARLSHDPDIHVLLLEAGSAERSAAMSNPVAWPALAGTAVDWGYATVPQTALNDEVIQLPAGKALGGSSAINGLMHIRGDRSSYDAWEAAGALGWNYDTLLPFFKRTERAVGRDPSYRGLDGPMVVAPATARDPLWEACFDAALAAGHPANEDGNAATAEGISWNEVNVVGEARQSAADAYLAPAAQRPNLTIVTGAHALRLLVEGTACRGVTYLAAGHVHNAFAGREVVLAAGAIRTPHLLLLSGIGPGQHLRDHGVNALVDLPGVGANLHDHVKSEVSYTASRSVRPGVFARKPRALVRTDPTRAPDMQMIFIEFPIHPRWTPGPEDGYAVIHALMTAASRGTVRLAGDDPTRSPLIDPRYLCDERDMERMVAGARLAREIGEAAPLAPWREKELYPGPAAQTDAELRAHLQRSVSSYWHPAGTCRIGTDLLSVVDPRLRVHGVTNLRVVDASVMPSPIAGNTNATVLAVAERAASLLLAGEDTRPVK
ncbi:GMC family oxidoreductase [Pseudonocardia xinjiangensis]|uniref:GMC family oxidoreductase n=1 Tax=Pseudonocardia xinjiangensis TaxID=75289 RepID=UPI003D915942